MSEQWRDLLTFAGREIPQYAVHVKPEDLEVGNVYFRVSYLDNDMVVPEVTPLVYVGRDLDPPTENSHQLYFQDAGSYFAGIRWEDDAPPVKGENEEERFQSWLERGHFELFEESQVSVLEFENALNLLLLCSLRRQGLHGRRLTPRSS